MRPWEGFQGIIIGKPYLVVIDGVKWVRYVGPPHHAYQWRLSNLLLPSEGPALEVKPGDDYVLNACLRAVKEGRIYEQ